MNLGFADARVLFEILSQRSKFSAPGDILLLRKYERARLNSYRPLPADPDPALRQWILDITANRQNALENTRKMLARGVPVLVGSDAANAGHVPGAGLHWEMDLLIEAGMTPAQVLSQAAVGNLQAWGGPTGGSVVEEGKPANVFWVPGDVEKDFQAVHHVGAVLTQGRIWEVTH